MIQEFAIVIFIDFFTAWRLFGRWAYFVVADFQNFSNWADMLPRHMRFESIGISLRKITFSTDSPWCQYFCL